MGDLTKNFSLEEFECPCCHVDWIDRGFVEKLQKIREEINIPMVPTSGYRCRHHNFVVGGAVRSAHMKGLAADFCIESSQDKAVITMLALQLGMSIGIKFGKMIHIDDRQEDNIIFGYK